MFNRDRAIRELVDCLAYEFNQGYLSFDDMVINGFTGLASLTDEELIDELRARDISELFGDCDDE